MNAKKSPSRPDEDDDGKRLAVFPIWLEPCCPCGPFCVAIRGARHHGKCVFCTRGGRFTVWVEFRPLWGTVMYFSRFNHPAAWLPF